SDCRVDDLALLDLHQCAPHLLADWLDGCSLFFCVFLLMRSFAWSRPVFQTFPVRRACTRVASVMFRRSYQLLSSVADLGRLTNSKLSLIACCLVNDPIAPPYIDR